MSNRLAAETSPYLLEHAENPVDWYPWGPEALEKARRENKPLLLSIGYSACHWCHVMARESFEDTEVAALINRDFVPVKVDREERPDLDQIYMRAVQAMTGSGGWPMTVFLLPDATPFFAGTYFPPSDRFGMPAFRRVLQAVAEAYAQRPAEVRDTATQVRDFLQRPAITLARGVLGPALLDEAYQRVARDFDPVHGGFGGAPKFPQPMVLDFLMRTSARTGGSQASEMAVTTLSAMARGGLYDQLGGGFHRYSVDERWLVPHFEKMLYDNALLASAYLEAWQLTGEAQFRRIAEETLGFVTRELLSPEGGFYSSLDADSEGEEGRFYVWTPAELEAALGPQEAVAFGSAFDVTARGNFEGRNILHPVSEQATDLLLQVRPRLLPVRERRVRPHRDEKVVAAWNGLMLRAFADAARTLDRADLRSVAEANARFLLTSMQIDGRMRRSYKDGRAPLPGYLEDQAAVADGLFSLYMATFDPVWLRELRRLIEVLMGSFFDESTQAFFDTASDHTNLLVRPQDITDNAEPSGTSLAVDVLLRAGALLGEQSWTQRSLTVVERLAPTAAKAPLAFGRLLAALDFHLGRPLELAVIGPPAAPQTRALLEVVRHHFLPNLLLAVAPEGDGTEIPLLQERPAIDSRPTAYLCEGFTCQMPTADPAELERQVLRVSSQAS
jgi:uncharacterized protein YyaL (SSP411 family)